MTPARLLKTINFFQSKRDDDAKFIEKLWCDFGQSIRVERKKRGIGLKQFAEMLAVSKGMVGFLESGKRRWNFKMACKAVKLLGNNQ